MNRHSMINGLGIGTALLLLPLMASAFNSGSTGADGAFTPNVNTELQLPPDGVFNFTSVNIPNGVTVTFKRNATNTPLVILAQGDIVVAGTIDVSGKSGAPTGPSASDGGDPTNDGLPGDGGPGGFDGGRGGISSANALDGGNGLGPGGGAGGYYSVNDSFRYYGGSGGSFGTAGTGSKPGKIYGNQFLRPLIGGSGGGGGYAYHIGSGGGGGGGAVLLATSGEIRVDGSVNANGGLPGEAGYVAGVQVAGGAGGSGGAIRLMASKVSGRGVLRAQGGVKVNYPGFGGSGYIRIESEVLTGNISGDPPFTYSQPGAVFVPGLPGLAITSIAGVAVPANPVGHGDVALAAATPNPAEIRLHTNGVPPGTVIAVTVTPEFGAKTTVDSPPTAGSLDDGTTSVDINIPDGRSVISATTTFTVLAALGNQFAPYAQGEKVERVRLQAEPGQPSKTILLTASGRELEVPAAALAAGW